MVKLVQIVKDSPKNMSKFDIFGLFFVNTLGVLENILCIERFSNFHFIYYDIFQVQQTT